MTTQVRPGRLTTPSRDVIDAGVAAALLLLVGAQVAAEPVDGPLIAHLAFASVITLSVVWRRSAPLAALAGVAAGVVLQGVLLGPLVSFGEFLAAILVAYSAAAYLPAHQAALGAVLLAVAVTVHVVAQPGPVAPFELVYESVYFGGAMLIGRVVRRRSSHLSGVEARVARLEREQEERERAAVAAERARIARELHDVISHSVGVMVVQAGAARSVIPGSADGARAAVEHIERTGRETLTELRRLLGILRSEDEEPDHAPQPGIASIGTLVEQVRASGTSVELHLEGDRRPLAPGLELAAHRIVQEALTNVVKHAAAATVVVRVRFGADALELTVVDDGRGTPGATGGGHGLVGMRERASLYGGSLDAGPDPAGGFAVRASLPIDSADR